MPTPNWGTVFTPRAGSEVMVDFIDDDGAVDVAIGQLHHGQHDLPWPAGVDSGAKSFHCPVLGVS